MIKFKDISIVNKLKLQDPEVAEHINSKVKKFEYLMSISKLNSSGVEFKSIVRSAKKWIQKILNCEEIVFYRFKAEEELFIYNTHEGKDKHLSEKKIPTSVNSFPRECKNNMAITEYSDCTADIKLSSLPEHLKKLGVKSLLLGPLIYEGEVIGVIEASYRSLHKFSNEDHYFMEAICNQLTASMENVILTERMNSQFVQIVQSLADAIGKKDAYTGGHTKRVGVFAEMIGDEMDLTFEEKSNLKLAAVLHDIGKIGIEDKILKKSSALTNEEFEIMKSHPALGHEILGHIDNFKNVTDGMRYHHERPDGKGYPFGLVGDEIPKLASIISVADTFDAMISTRPYRKGLPPMVAFQEILNNSGSQFCTEVVTAFEKGFKKTHMYRPKGLVKNKRAS